MSWLSDLFNPPAANIPAPQFQTYQPQGTSSADSAALGGIGNLGSFNQYAQYLPQAQQLTGSIMNNPYAGGYQSGAGTASALGQTGAFNQFGAGGNLYGMAGSIANTAFDPQNDLYNRSVQQLQDQTRAGQAARGIQTTPYGAGLENQALGNFNIDWNNNQLQRQIQGGQAAGGLTTQGAQLQSGAPGQYLSASSLPYSTYNGITGNQFGALSNLGQFGQGGGTQAQQPIADYLSYLGWGSGQMGANNATQQNTFSDALSQDKQAFQEQQSIFSGLGNIAGGLWNTKLSGGGTAGGSVLSSIFSDERVKEDIQPVGHLLDGQRVYAYRYKGDRTPRIGLIAQEVQRVRPDAVTEVGGIKAVDYAKATELSRGIAALSKWAA